MKAFDGTSCRSQCRAFWGKECHLVGDLQVSTGFCMGAVSASTCGVWLNLFQELAEIWRHRPRAASSGNSARAGQVIKCVWNQTSLGW